MAQTATRAFRSESGIVSIDPESKTYRWSQIIADAVKVEHVERLSGWGKWFDLYRVYGEDEYTSKLYVVSGE